jgi:8-oxo-dGTP diphosphatase
MEHVVLGALIQNNRMLLGHRTAGRAAYPSAWDLPGGHVESGEAPPDALVRELSEEVGVLISRPTDPPLAVLCPLAHEPRVEFAIWVVTEWAGQVTNCAPNEHDELRWFTADELQAVCLAHTEYREMLPLALAAADKGTVG